MKENYPEKTESSLLELAKQDEMKNKNTVLASIFVVLSYLSIAIIRH